ncbi:MAG: DNA-directed RNA polymerase subunit omega [Trueperaceae bacterium]|nr:MAG: DNA-directed RNA polymerase subunit omega [Trueperaceae bacterium]
MHQQGYDYLMSLTDSRYRLSMIAARRAAQLKLGVPTVLEAEEIPKTTNTVTIALKELELNRGVEWGDSLPTLEQVKQVVGQDDESDGSGFVAGGERR